MKCFFNILIINGLSVWVAVVLLCPAFLSAAGQVIITPVEIDTCLVNPYRGWGIWTGPHYQSAPVKPDVRNNTVGFADNCPLFSFVVVDFYWKDVEPSEGFYDWSKIDSIITYWSARGKQMYVRFMATVDAGWNNVPGGNCAPDWIWDKGLKYKEFCANGGCYRYPDYGDPSYLSIFLPCLETMLSHYRNHFQSPGNKNNIMLDMMMGYGDWGECHTFLSNYTFSDKNTKHHNINCAIDVYIRTLCAGKTPPYNNIVLATMFNENASDSKWTLPAEEGLTCWANTLVGEVVSGDYETVLFNLSKISFSPKVCLVLFGKETGMEEFISTLIQIMPGVSLIGDDASRATGQKNGELIPESDDIAVLAVSDGRFCLESLNIYNKTDISVEVKRNSNLRRSDKLRKQN